MGKTDLNPESFADTYIDIALGLVAGREQPLDFGLFDESLRKGVSERLGISKEDVLYAHHSFHWTFFCNGNSPFEYFQTGKPEDSAKVRLKREVSSEDKHQMTEYLFSNYGDYLSHRLGNISNHNPLREV